MMRNQPSPHGQIAPLLAVYRDWNEAERRMIMAHVAVCSECATQLAHFQALDQQLRQLPHPNPDPHLAERFYAGLKQKPSWQKRWPEFTAQLAGAAALVLVFFSLWAIFQARPLPAILPPTSATSPLTYDLQPKFTLDAAQGSTTLALSRDGQFLATAQGTSIQIWLVTNGRRLRAFTNLAAVENMAFTPNSLFLLVQTSQGITQWRVNNGELMHTFAVATQPYAASNEQLALVTADAIELWSIRSGELEQSFAYDAAAITTLLWSHDGETLLTGSNEGQIQFWTRKGELLQTAIGAGQPVLSLTLAGDDSQLVVHDATQQVQVWSVTEGRVKQSWDAAASPILSLVFANDDTSLFLSLADGKTQFYNLADGTLVGTLTGPPMIASAWALTPDSFRLVALTADHQVQILERPSKE